DGKTLRERKMELKIPENYEKMIAKNPAGFITSELIGVLRRAVDASMSNKKVAVIVDGEEDLAVIPLSLLMPENSLICYGQPGEGVVALVLDKKIKEVILKLLKQMVVVEKSEEIKSLGVM
ncbi:MAG: GTP-dependent dephospho-CoA kinase family protein, partial [Archaeoglobaceae archaeon]